MIEQINVKNVLPQFKKKNLIPTNKLKFCLKVIV